MAIHDFTSQRLYVPGDLASGATLALERDQVNYLRNVMRLSAGDVILVFNGRDGEWRAEIAEPSRKLMALVIADQVRPQQDGPDLHYLFAPLKRARLDYMVQKATELGVARLVPVLTRHTMAERVKLERVHANVIEAAEQCGILRVPSVLPPAKLETVLDGWERERVLIVCDEAAKVADPLASLTPLAGRPLALLIGPEGGFAEAERSMLLACPFVIAVSLGPRIMRADTAAVAALALINAACGDWR